MAFRICTKSRCYLLEEGGHPYTAEQWGDRRADFHNTVHFGALIGTCQEKFLKALVEDEFLVGWNSAFPETGHLCRAQELTTPVISSSHAVAFLVGNGAETLLNQVLSHFVWNQFCRIQGRVWGVCVCGGRHTPCRCWRWGISVSVSGSRWPCVYSHLWNAYVWQDKGESGIAPSVG